MQIVSEQTGREFYHSAVASDFTKENISGKYFSIYSYSLRIKSIDDEGLIPPKPEEVEIRLLKYRAPR